MERLSAPAVCCSAWFGVRAALRNEPIDYRRQHHAPCCVHDLDRHGGRAPAARRQLRRPPRDLIRRDGGSRPHPTGCRLAELGLQPANHWDEPHPRAEVPHKESPGPSLRDSHQSAGVDGAKVVSVLRPVGQADEEVRCIALLALSSEQQVIFSVAPNPHPNDLSIPLGCERTMMQAYAG